MSNDLTSTLLSPKTLRQQTPDLDFNQLPDVRRLYDLLSWFRGDYRIRVDPAVALNITASNNGTINVEPPDDGEEWEIYASTVFDGQHVDVADQVNFLMRDDLIAQIVLLQQSQITATIPTTNNVVVYPSKDTGQIKQTVNAIPGYPPIIVKRKDKSTPWLRFQILYSATATVGTRVVTAATIYRRRPLV